MSKWHVPLWIGHVGMSFVISVEYTSELVDSNVNFGMICMRAGCLAHASHYFLCALADLCSHRPAGLYYGLFKDLACRATNISIDCKGGSFI